MSQSNRSKRDLKYSENQAPENQADDDATQAPENPADSTNQTVGATGLIIKKEKGATIEPADAAEKVTKKRSNEKEEEYSLPKKHRKTQLSKKEKIALASTKGQLTAEDSKVDSNTADAIGSDTGSPVASKKTKIEKSEATVDSNYPALKTRNSPDNLMKAIRVMTEAQLRDVRSIGFGALIDLKVKDISTILSYMLENFDPMTQELRLREVRRVRFESSDVRKVLGFPNGIKALMPRNKGITNNFVQDF
ncbi:hypothetical protein CASFOL_004578 [Castilleja foliolosa]|uniref:Uncharacterized protein n=1 Tax=Castilleja foliolosa TaxID=1961234 RepID=A0ABD3EAY9_9LAMI